MLQRLWNWIGENEKQIKLVFAIIGAGYVIFQYQAHVESTRIDRAVQNWKEVREGKFFESVTRLNQFHTDEKYLDWAKQTTPETYHQALYEKLAELSLNDDVYTLRGLYGGVAICAEAKLCDRETSCTLFFREVQNFRENYRGHLETWAADLGDNSVAEIKAFAEETCADEFAAYCREVPQSPDCRSGSG